MKKIITFLTIIFYLLVFFIEPTFASGAAESASNNGDGNFNMFKAIVTSVIMLLLIIIIATERIHRTMVAFLFGALLIFVSHTLGFFFPEYFEFLTLSQAFGSIHGEVIALLAGMMIIVGVLSETGLFQWIAYKLFKISKGCTLKLLVLFMISTALLSAILDNVTTMFLITPVAISISRIVGVNPLAFLMPMIIASNVGGTATLIGDPPNIMIGAYAGLSFNQFLVNLGIPVIFIMIATIFQMKFMYGKQLRHCKKLDVDGEVEKLHQTCQIKHPKLLRVSLFLLGFVVLFFLLHGVFHMSAAVPALTGAALLMLFRDRIIMNKGNYEESETEIKSGVLKAFEKDIEWPVLAFFVFLFMIVGAVDASGVLTQLANLIQNTFGSDLFLTALVILWVAAIMSALLDNIPFTAVMLPVVGALVSDFNGLGMNGTILWWALAFGACFGGNGTLIGASANIVTVGLMEKEGIKVSFNDFLKVGLPAMFLQVIMASGFIYIMINFL